MALKDNSSPSDYIEKGLEQNDKKKEIKSNYINSEYEDSFDGEEKLEHQLVKIKSKIDIKLVEIDIDNIVTSKFKKIGRSDTLIGLGGIVEEWGVVTPIHVLALEHESMYMLLDGLRRIFASLRCGRKQILAVVWDFEDKTEGKEMANVISLMVNRSQHFTPKEMWEQMQVLEDINDASPGLIEFLLQMNAGESMKLKDIMLSGMDFAEIQGGLLNGDLTIEGAYKKLCNERKKIDKLAMEDRMSIEDTGSELGEEQRLGVEEVKEILEIDHDDDASLEDLDMTDDVRGDIVQDTKDRHPVDKAIRQGTFMRDEFKCRCCEVGGTEAYLDVLEYHHLIPVYLGGPDTVDNGICVCNLCHRLIHCYIFGKVHVDFAELDEKETARFKNIFRYGNVAIKSTKRVGMKKEDAMKEDAKYTRNALPGQTLAVNKEAFEASKLLNK